MKEHREKIYTLVQELMARNWKDDKERKQLKTLLVAMCDEVRKEATSGGGAGPFPVVQDPITRRFVSGGGGSALPKPKPKFMKPAGSCKYCNKPAGFGRIICRDCVWKKNNETER